MRLSTVILTILPFIQSGVSQASGSGVTTRYWDCCKPSCAWSGKATLAAGSNPVTTCDINDNPLSDYNVQSGCNGGSAYTCTDQSPWGVSDTLAYGFAATNIAGGSESSWCCACYQLTFTSGPVAGKTMIVQSTNTGGDLGSNQFDIMIPGGGFGIFNGCTAEFGTPSTGWGAQYGGISSRSQCDAFPASLQAGCYWRFDWFEDADNPSVSFQQVSCPAALIAKSGCLRADDSSSPAPFVSDNAATTTTTDDSIPAATTTTTEAAPVTTDTTTTIIDFSTTMTTTSDTTAASAITTSTTTNTAAAQTLTTTANVASSITGTSSAISVATSTAVIFAIATAIVNSVTAFFFFSGGH